MVEASFSLCIVCLLLSRFSTTRGQELVFQVRYSIHLLYRLHLGLPTGGYNIK